MVRGKLVNNFFLRTFMKFFESFERLTHLFSAIRIFFFFIVFDFLLVFLSTGFVTLTGLCCRLPVGNPLALAIVVAATNTSPVIKIVAVIKGCIGHLVVIRVLIIAIKSVGKGLRFIYLCSPEPYKYRK